MCRTVCNTTTDRSLQRGEMVIYSSFPVLTFSSPSLCVWVSSFVLSCLYPYCLCHPWEFSFSKTGCAGPRRGKFSFPPSIVADYLIISIHIMLISILKFKALAPGQSIVKHEEVRNPYFADIRSPKAEPPPCATRAHWHA